MIQQLSLSFLGRSTPEQGGGDQASIFLFKRLGAALLGSILILSPVTLWGQPTEPGLAEVHEVSFSLQPDGMQVFVNLDRAVPFSKGRLSDPSRVYFDLRGARVPPRIQHWQEFPHSAVERVRVGQFTPDTVRIVFDLAAGSEPTILLDASPPQMLIRVQEREQTPVPLQSRPGRPASRSTRKDVVPTGQIGQEAATLPSATRNANPAMLHTIQVSSQAGRTLIFVGLQPVSQYRRGSLEKPHRVYFDYPGTRLAESVPRVIDVQDGQVRRVRLGQFQHDVVRLVLELEPDIQDRVKWQTSPPGVFLDLVSRSIRNEMLQTAAADRLSTKLPQEFDEDADGVVDPAEPGPNTVEPGSQPLTPVGIRPSIMIPLVQKGPTIEDYLEGRPREAEALITGFKQITPRDGAPVSEDTTAYLSYDKSHLYVVFDCRDDPDQIRSRMTKREQISDDDRVSIYLDTFNDRERAFLFSANPRGIMRDGVFAEGQGTDLKFDALWESEAKLTPEGYLVWMKIPFRSLRFDPSTEQSWGIALQRYIRRREETSYWPHITRDVQSFAQQFADLRGLSQISTGSNFEITPYATYTHSNFLGSTPEGNLGYLEDDEFRAGIDAKAVIKDSLTLDLTLNPDFSQVESDEPQVTINKRFEVFFPEKRPFFLENADFFQTPERLFFSRRIVDPQFGARLTGKIGDWRLGILAMDDRAPGANVSASDPDSGARAPNAVFRLQRVFDNQSNLGVLLTSRDFGDSYNRVYSVDTRVKLNDNWFFSGQAAGSETRTEDGNRLSDPIFLAGISHSGTHASFGARYSDRAPDFRSHLGFIPRTDIRQIDTYYGYLWYPEGANVLSFGPSLSASGNWDRLGRLQDWFLNGSFGLNLSGPMSFTVNYIKAYTLYQELDFRYGRTDFSAYTALSNWGDLSLTYGEGTEINYSPGGALLPYLGRARNASLYLGLRPWPHVSIDTTYIFTGLWTQGGQYPLDTPTPVAIFNNHLLRWRANYQFNRELSLRCIIDYYSVYPNTDLVALDNDKFLTYDVLLTYLLNPGMALYFGYNNRYWNIELDPSHPFGYSKTGLPSTSASWQLFAKLSWLFRF